MNAKSKKRRSFQRSTHPPIPGVTPYEDWLPANRSFYGDFRNWLFESGYSISAMKLYGVAVRQAIGFLNRPYWQIDPDADLERAWEFLQGRPIASSTLMDYHKGIIKLADYLRLRCRTPRKPKEINWRLYIGALPAWLQEDIQLFIRHCQRSWPPERRYHLTIGLISPLTHTLRWMMENQPLNEIRDMDPERWFAYLDARLSAGISPATLNRQLCDLKHLLHFLKEQERLICERMLLVDSLNEAANLPKDLPPEQLRQLQRAIKQDCASSHAGIRRMGLMDQAWFLLMLHSGLRSGEIRFLRLTDIDWERNQIRIERSKGLKDRLVPFSPAAAEAIQTYLEVRGPDLALPEQLFIFRHQMLSPSYCYERLHTYGKRCGVIVTPHQLRHSCATLLLNAGAPVLTVQAILGHQQVDTTLGYARLYDGTIAADYYQAMAVIEQRLATPEDHLAEPPGVGQLLALVDSLRNGLLDEKQVETVRQLRVGLSALAERENVMSDVKVQSAEN